MQKPKIFFLVGPTSIGKTEVAVYLAKKLNAEIVSCDSMQIYKGMDIVTSKPAEILRKKITHHLIDVISPAQEYDVAKYRQDALTKIKQILKRGKIPLFVGGTGLYMSVLIDGIFNQDTKNKSIRSSLYKQARIKGSQYLYKRLQQVDPLAASKIHPHDTKRLIRALEVFDSTARPISYLQTQRFGIGRDYGIKIFCLNMLREKLYKRIDQRIEEMFNKGVVDEVRRLLKLKLSKTAYYAIGIKELKGYFDGVYDLQEAKRLMKRNTRHFAKRQLTWFRKDKRIRWIEVEDGESPGIIAGRIVREYINE